MARRVADKPWEADFQYNSSFEDPQTGADLLAFNIYALAEGVHTDGKPGKPSPDVPPYLRDLYRYPLLTREGERVLFLRMNYAKYRANKIRESHPQVLDPDYKGPLKESYQKLIKAAYATRNVIAEHNLRLVVALAKGVYIPGLTFDGIISNGNLSLLRAIDKFDVGRINQNGTSNKFSTYASWTIKKNYWRDFNPTKKEIHIIADDVNDLPIPDPRTTDEHPPEDFSEETAELLRKFRRLDAREQTVLRGRYGIDTEEETLQRIGEVLKISKERVRQIQKAATEKLRESFGVPKRPRRRPKRAAGPKAACGVRRPREGKGNATEGPPKERAKEERAKEERAKEERAKAGDARQRSVFAFSRRDQGSVPPNPPVRQRRVLTAAAR